MKRLGDNARMVEFLLIKNMRGGQLQISICSSTKMNFRLKKILVVMLIATMIFPYSFSGISEADSVGGIEYVVGTNPVFTAGATVPDDTYRYIINIDYDSDGDEDFIAYNGSKLVFYKNDGSGSFTEVAPNVTLPVQLASEYLVADFDNDGDEDICVLGDYFVNNGDGTFATGTNPVVSAGATVDDGTYRYIINIDYDSDGDEDFIAYNESNPVFYKNDGSGSFTEVTPNVTLPLQRASEYLVADFDNDGDEDICVPGDYFVNNGDGTFTEVENPVSTAGATVDDGTYRYIINIDYDSDGDEDFIAYNEGKFIFYKNDGSGSFTAVDPNVTLPLRNASEYLVADFDNDGDEDICVLGEYFTQNGTASKTNNRPPRLTSTSPADDATDFPTNGDIVLDFDEPILTVGAGKISIYKTSDDSLVEAIEGTSERVSGVNSNSMVIKPSVALDGETAYYIKIEPKAFFDEDGMTFAGILDKTTLNFLTKSSSTSNDNLNKIYFSEAIAGHYRVSRVDLDGTNFEQLFYTETGEPKSVTVDPNAGKIYFSDIKGSDAKVYSLDIDGSNLQLILSGIYAEDIAVDAINSKIYFTESSTPVPGDDRYRVCRIDLDGTNLETLYDSPTGTPKSIAVDPVARKIYFSDPYESVKKIYSANLDGSNPQAIISDVCANDIAVDPINNKIYFTEALNSHYRVVKADLEGTNLESIYESPVGSPQGVTVNPKLGKIYFSDPNASVQKIYSANLDGTDVTEIVTGMYANDVAFPFVESDPASSNTVPTASNFTVSSGLFQDVTYTFGTADFGYSDGDSDVLDHLRITAVPASGTLYVDANDNDLYDSGEAVSNGSTISKANLDAGNLQYITDNRVDTSFTFDVNDGTDYSNTTYQATLNISAGVTISTQAVTSITSTAAIGNGNITDLGKPNPTAHGVCWNTTGSPTISDDKTDEGGATATGAFTTSITGLSANTKYYVKAYATNTAGTSYGDEVVFSTDVTAPALTAGEVNRTGDTTGTVKFTSNEAGNYYYAVVTDGASAPTIDTSGTGTACTTSETTITDPTGLTEGAKDIYIKVKDASGNVSDALKIVIDAYVAPDTTAPVLTAGAVERTGDTTGTVKFTSNEAGTYYYAVVVDGASAPTIDTSGTGTACTTSETTITDPTGLTEGAKDIYIKVKDASGNVSDALKIVIDAYVAPDTTAPVLTAGAVERTGDTTGTVKFTSNEAGTYYYAVVVDGASAPTIDTSGTGTACTTSETTITDPTGLTEGAKDIYIKVKDASGNVSDALKIVIDAYVAPDTTAPALTAGAVERTSDTEGTVKFTSNEAGNYYYAVVTGGASAPTIDTSGTGTACTTSETTITDPTGLTEGAKDIYIKVKDASGNVSDALKIVIDAYVAPDTTAPALTAGAVERTSDTEGTVKFTSNEAGSYYYAIVTDGASAPTIDTSGTGTACTTSETTITDPTGLTEGAKDIYIKVKDASGNVSNALKIVIDAYVAPDITAPILTAGAVNRTGDTTGTVKFTSNEAGSYYYAIVTDGASAPTIDTSGTGTACTTSETTITDPTGLTEGAKDIYIKVKDASGNVSNALKIVIDAYVAPDTIAPVLTAGTVNRTGDNTGTVKFTSNEAGSYYYAIVTEGASAPTIDTSGTGTACTTSETTITDPTGLTEGAKDIYIKVKDASGNVSDALKIVIDAYVAPDTTAPALTAGAVERTSDTEGTVKFTSNEAGSYYYAIVTDGASAPTIDTSGTGTACTTSETTITDPTGLTEGAKDIYIKVKDASGNVSNALKIVIDAYVAPDTIAPVLTAGTVNRTGDNTGTVKFTSNEAGSYYYAIVTEGASAPTIDTSGTGTACTTSETTITDPTGLTEGAKDIYIKVKDVSGNVSNALKIDIEAYVAPDITAPILTAGAVNRTGDTEGTVKFTSNEAGTYYYAVVVDGASAPTIDTSGSGTACTTSETTITDPTGLNSGAKDIYIKVKDASGNVSNALKIDIEAYVAPDTTAPVITAGAVDRTGDTTGTVKFTSNEAGTYYYAVVVDGATAPVISTSGAGITCTTSETTITNPTGLTEGAKDIYIKVKDASGNVSNALKIDIEAYVAPDTTAPILTAGAVDRTGDTTGTVKFTSNESGTYYYVVVADGATAPVISTSGAGITCTTSETTITNPTGLTEGAKDIYIKVKDASGNVSNALKIDIEAYVAPDTTAPILTAGAVDRTGDTTGTVKFTSNESGTYYYAVVVDGATAPVISTSSAGITCTTSETTITNPTGLTEGAKDIYIKVKDASGNVSTALKIDIPAYNAPDTTAPVLTAGAVDRTGDTTGTVKFTSNESGTYYYVVVADGATAPVISTSGAGITCTTSETMITNPTGLTEGAKDIYIKVKDASGNVSTALKIDIPAYNAPDTGTSDDRDDSPGSDGGGGSNTSTPINDDKVIVTVNGTEQKVATEEHSIENGKTLTTVAVESDAIDSIVRQVTENTTEAIKNVIQVSVSDENAEVAKVELTGDVVKKLEDNTFDVSIKHKNIEYVIPAEEFTISKVAENLKVPESDLLAIKIEVKIAELNQETVAQYNTVVESNGAEIVFPPVEFEIIAKTTQDNGTVQEQSISQFEDYVDRIMEVPSDIDPNKITTGIVFNSDGTYSHVPTKVLFKDGKWYAMISSLTNSSYSVIWNPVTVKSVRNHWSEEAVNSLASRLVILNPEQFNPDRAITRGEFAGYIVRALGLYRKGFVSETKFTDLNSQSEQNLNILIANDYGIISGYSDGTFKSDHLISREEAMVMYQKAMVITKLEGNDKNRYQSYTDYGTVSNWAVDSVREVLSAHVFSGTTDKTISPKSTLTHAQAAQAIENLLEASGLIK